MPNSFETTTPGPEVRATVKTKTDPRRGKIVLGRIANEAHKASLEAGQMATRGTTPYVCYGSNPGEAAVNQPLGSNLRLNLVSTGITVI